MANRLGLKRLLLGVTGSVAAYKSAELARYFMKRGFDVRVAMTESATKFITPLTFQSLTHHPVATTFWEEDQTGQIGHIALADWAGAVLIAPATADFIAKMAHGFAESSLLATVLATKAPVIVAPAMNVNMYNHPQTRENIEALQARGVHIVEPDSGSLACGWTGKGRLAAPYEIYAITERAIGPADLIGQRVLISAGPTREAIDPVRYLSNRSSGKMGLALAREAFRRGAEVTLVHGPLSPKQRVPAGVKQVSVTSAEEMHSAILDRVFEQNGQSRFDTVVMAAAVADYRPKDQASDKIKKSNSAMVLDLVPNEDIVKELGVRKGARSTPVLVGFAVETRDPEALIEEAQRKLNTKNLDVVVGNLAKDSFDKDTNQVWIVSKGSAVIHIETARKGMIARRIWDHVIKSDKSDSRTRPDVISSRFSEH